MSEEKVYTEAELKAMADALLAAAEPEKSAKPAKKRAPRAKKEAQPEAPVKTVEERLQELLAKADVMEDIITLESAIAETELQIERLTGTLRKYDALVDYATVEINLEEVYELTEQEQPVIGFGAKLVEAFKTGTNNFVDDLERFALRFARNWISRTISLVFWIVVIVVVVRLLRKGKKLSFLRKKKEQAPPPPPANDKPEEK